MKIEPSKQDHTIKNIKTSERQKGIEELKKQIQNGTYKVDTKALAQKILDSGVLDD